MEDVELRLIGSRGYRRNVGIERLLDHAQMGFNLRSDLRGETTLPDVAFVGYPPIETAAVLTDWLGKRDVPTLVDVKDQWPTIFERAAPALLRPVARTALWPYRSLARRAFRNATGLSAMSEAFLDWALGVAQRPRRVTDAVFPLTCSAAGIDGSALEEARLWWDAAGIAHNGQPRVMFVGSHSKAFDFDTVLEAARLTASVPHYCEWVLCGTGEMSASLKARTSDLENVFFPGHIDQPRIVALSERCMAAIAPYRSTPDFQMSLPNKVLDALSLGMPILSPLGGEVASLIERHDVGLRYGGDARVALSQCVARLATDRPLRERLARNARIVFERDYSFSRVYGGLVQHLEQMACRNATQDAQSRLRHGASGQ